MYTRQVRRKKKAANKMAQKPQAVALGYNPQADAAPRVLASGSGYLAGQILDLARDNGIPIREDPVLAAALAEVDLGTAIPPELYALVAEVLAYIYRLQGKAGDS